MKIIFFSANIDTIDELKKNHPTENFMTFSELTSFEKILDVLKQDFIVIADFDSVANDINKLISANKLPMNTVVLERNPEISSGKILISHKVKAYGNTRMSHANFMQMLQTVEDGKVWTYPELTVALAKDVATPVINDEAKKLVQNRLSAKEIEVIYMLLDGLTNDAIAKELNITTRTVKAHVSSIFSKLHVNDRLSLVLLLK